MKKIYSIITAIILFSGIASAQLPTFVSVYGIEGDAFGEFPSGVTIVPDASGNIYIAGNYSGTNNDFNPGVGILSVSAVGTQDAYFGEYSPTGTLIWLKALGASSRSVVMGNMIMDANSNLYITGTIDGPVDFDPGAGVTTLSIGTGSKAVFIAKYTSTGNLVWAHSLINGTLTYPKINISSSNGLYITGQIGSGTIDFDFGPGVANVSGSGHAFVAKYDLNASYKWALPINSSVSSEGDDIVSDATGCYVAGEFMGSANFNPLGSALLVDASGGFFLAKYDSLGNYVYANQIGINCGVQWTPSLDLDMSGNIYYTSSWSGTNKDFDPGPGTALLSSGANDMFLAKYANNGNYIFAETMAGTAGTSNRPTDIKVGSSGAIYLTGDFIGTTDFNSGVGTNNLTSAAHQAGFLGKYNLSGNYIWALQNHIAGATSNSCGKNICYDGTYIYWASDGNTSSDADFDPAAAVGTYNDFFGANQFSKYSDCTLPPAQPGTITGTTTICSGSSNTYSVTAVAGATSYTWTLPGGWTGVSATNSITTTASATSGNITVTSNNGCGSSTPQTLAIIVNTIPSTPGAITGTTPICSGSSNTYSITAVAGATSYTWTLPGGWTGVSTTNSIITTASTTSGNITVTANNTCGNSSAATLSITVNTIPVTPGAITGTTPICSGSSNTYSTTAVAGATSYTWTLPGGWTGVSTTNSITTTASATSGNITVTANNACGSSAVQTKPIVVNTTPATPGTITGTTTICSGSSNTYSITAVAGATYYTWTLPGGWTGVSTTNSITTTASATSGNITVTANNTCGSSSSATLAITVNSIPVTPGAITGTTPVCVGTTHTYNVTAVAGATTYTWTLPGGWTGVSTTNSITTTASSTSGNITVTANNTCGNSSASTLAITVNPLPTIVASGGGAVCVGTSICLAGAGGNTYSWNGPCGYTSTTASPCITPTISCGGTFTVTGTDLNGCVNTSSTVVTVNPLPTVTYSQTPSLVCANNTSVPLTGVTPSGGAFSGTAVTGATFNAVTAGVGSYSITYTYTDVNSCVNTATSNITVSACTGIQQNTIADEIMIYPNPFSSIITLQGIETGAIVEIFNLIGEKIHSSQISNDKTEINLSNESNGIYFIKIGTVTRKIIKQ